MAFENQISIAFTDAELSDLDSHLTAIEDILAGKTVALNPKQNKLFGRLGNETENYTNMIREDVQSGGAVQLLPNGIDKVEWEKDVAARKAIAPRLTRVNSIATRMEQTNRVLGYDIYNTTNRIYRFVRNQYQENEPGYQAYYDKWKVQWPGNVRMSDEVGDTDADNTDNNG